MKKAALLIFILAVISIASGAAAQGADSFGVPAYPGGSYDQQTSKVLKDMMKLNASCYRTKDSVSKVVDFYRQQDGLKLIHSDAQGAFFKKDKTDITVQNPWMDMNTGKMNQDTLISIVGLE